MLASRRFAQNGSTPTKLRRHFSGKKEQCYTLDPQEITEREHAGITEGLWQARDYLARLIPYLKKTNQCSSLQSAPRMLLRLVYKADFALAASEQLSLKEYNEAESTIREGRLTTRATLERSRNSPWTLPSDSFLQILTFCPMYALGNDVPTIKNLIKKINALHQSLSR